MSKRGSGEGSIYQRRDGRWEARVTVGHDGGRRVRKALYGGTRRSVQEKLTKTLRDLQTGLPVTRNERQTVGQYLDDWLRSTRSSIRPSTFVSYEGHVRMHLTPMLGRIPLVKLEPAHVRTLLADRLAAGKSPRTVQHSHAVLRRALGQALRDGTISRNVAALVSPPRSPRHEISPLSPEQARTLLDVAKGDRFEALFVTAIGTGLRQGELLGLRWADVDLEAGTLTVNRTLQRQPKALRGSEDGGYGHRYKLVEPKTSRSRRTLTMPAIVVSGLREHRIRQLQERIAAGPAWQGGWDLVFATGIGTPCDARNVAHRFEALLSRAGLPRIRFHDLRHSAATLLLAQGVSPRVIMDVLGHSQIAVTMNTYAHVMPAMQRDAADRMDAVFATAT